MKRTRARIAISGAVQGVGFRPFVHRLASELRLAGWVSNSPQGVSIEAEGDEKRVGEFLSRLELEKPSVASIQKMEHSFLNPVPYEGFEIRESKGDGVRTALILSDIATCPDCLQEIFDPQNRRHLYPFTNCTHCGPRFSITEALPYDRANTAMKSFTMCSECEREYHDPSDRRFHAQPNACSECGPHLELWDGAGSILTFEHDALLRAAEAVRQGQVLAMKGIGGFQLIADARNEDAVRKLRVRKHRAEKPFAVMFPEIASIEASCEVEELERELLISAAAPIVLIKKIANDGLAPSVAPGNPRLGAMLPYSPLHHLLMHLLGFPVVATSGNVSDEPICTDEREALERLRGVADLFLVHNRPIVRHMDDSVVRMMMGREMVLRRARGYAPMPLVTGQGYKSEPVVLAVGAHLKNTVALSVGEQIFVSQHIGDLETEQALSAFRESAGDLPRLYEASPQVLACDLHPDYLSTKFAQQKSAMTNGDETNQIIRVQHHYAHVLSCMADNELTAPVLGVSWDGTGYGADGTIWGGEFLVVNETSFDRFAHFRQFRLPGGDAAIKQPRRSALGVMWEIFGEEGFERNDGKLLEHFSTIELTMLKRMLATGVNSPVTSSAGRFFDAVASIIGLRQRSDFEGQAAMDLEFAITPRVEDTYVCELKKEEPLIFDWQPMIVEILHDLEQNRPIGVISAKFHNSLVELIVALARAANEETVVLTGGCFQNQYLTERAVRRLREEGFEPYWHHRVPPNDGGISLGQVVAALRREMPHRTSIELTSLKA